MTVSVEEIPGWPSDRCELLQQQETIVVSVLLQLVIDRDDRVRYWVARRPELTSDLIDTLRSDTSINVQRSLLINDAVPLLVPAVELASDVDVVVRRCLARRPSLDIAALNVLAEDDDGPVRCFVARHQNLDEPLAHKLIDDDWSVRLNLLTQLGRWKWLDKRLDQDPDPGVQEILSLARERSNSVSQKKSRI